ncbi:hypothetical protein EVAR_62979_1 [Eumeta japonica]|uniref:Uncharacterized protein n=1 Tax=Eumeta variegata TaxID=151549 RepID=A0A4C1ZEQ2_EUMVA|nr:hypothetical protein EVAR_62979_1 [Eumeta japonica]
MFFGRQAAAHGPLPTLLRNGCRRRKTTSGLTVGPRRLSLACTLPPSAAAYSEARCASPGRVAFPWHARCLHLPPSNPGLMMTPQATPRAPHAPLTPALYCETCGPWFGHSCPLRCFLAYPRLLPYCFNAVRLRLRFAHPVNYC